MSTIVQFTQGLIGVNQVIDSYRRVTEQNLGVDHTEADVLRFIQTQGPGKMKDIGLGLHLKLSNLTNIIDRLENAKLVRRVNSKTDRRAVIVELTQKGIKVLESYDEMFQVLAGKITERLSGDVVSATISCMDVITSGEFQPEQN